MASRGIDRVARHPRALEISDVNFNLTDLGFLKFLQSCGIELATRVRNLLTRFILDAARQLHSQQVCRLIAGRIESPIQLFVPNDQAIDRVERLQDVFARTQSECAQKNRSQELAFAIDANVNHFLLVVFKFHPRTAIGNDLAQEVSAVIGSLEEHTRRAVQLADNYALGSIHNEGAVVGHQRHVAEKDFLLFNIANGTIARFRILLVNRQRRRHARWASGPFEGSGRKSASVPRSDSESGSWREFWKNQSVYERYYSSTFR